MSRNPLDIMQTFSSKLLTFTALQLPSQRYCYKANDATSSDDLQFSDGLENDKLYETKSLQTMCPRMKLQLRAPRPRSKIYSSRLNS